MSTSTLNLLLAFGVVVLGIVWAHFAMRRRPSLYVLFGVAAFVVLSLVSLTSAASLFVAPENLPALAWLNAVLRGIVLTLLIGRVFHEVEERRLTSRQ